MSEVPEVPDEFDSQEELKQYIDQLHDQIEFLEEEFEQSEKEKLELKQELNDLEEKASRGGDVDGFQAIMEPLKAMQQRLEEFEEGYLDEDSDYGLEESQGAKELSEVFGADITQDPEDFKEELNED
ncbi:hypothetical protein [Haloarcula litorea]|uniref:hypothetical protein n=1 Tax=Haloarcula litorea TaxID=3032579 RepID=UPI0023E8229A|nr:hypothetical protein [Halomicroarcula sp. GDY20]